MKKKYKIKKIRGIKVVEKISKKAEREVFPRPAFFADKTKYNRKKLRKPTAEDD